MNCYNCKHFDKNDYVHGYGTCELQDIDFRIDNNCNIEKDRICYDTVHFGKPIGDSINTAELRPWDIGTPSYSTAIDWIDADLACPDCGGQMQKQMNVVYTSNPPMYGYRCKKCGAFHYRFS